MTDNPFVHIIQRSLLLTKTPKNKNNTKLPNAKRLRTYLFSKMMIFFAGIIIIKQNAPHQNRSEMLCVIDMHECFKRDDVHDEILIKMKGKTQKRQLMTFLHIFHIWPNGKWCGAYNCVFCSFIFTTAD